MVLLIVLLLLFSVLAAVFFLGQGKHILCMLYRIPTQEIDEYDFRKLCRFAGGVTCLVDIGFFLIVLSHVFETPVLISLGALVAVLSIFVATAIPLGRFRK